MTNKIDFMQALKRNVVEKLEPMVYAKHVPILFSLEKASLKEFFYQIVLCLHWYFNNKKAFFKTLLLLFKLPQQ